MMENVEQMAEAVDAAEDAAAVEQAQKEAEEAQKEAESSLDERVQQQLRKYQALLTNKWPDVDWRREDLPNELELDHNWWPMPGSQSGLPPLNDADREQRREIKMACRSFRELIRERIERDLKAARAEKAVEEFKAEVDVKLGKYSKTLY